MTEPTETEAAILNEIFPAADAAVEQTPVLPELEGNESPAVSADTVNATSGIAEEEPAGNDATTTGADTIESPLTALAAPSAGTVPETVGGLETIHPAEDPFVGPGRLNLLEAENRALSQRVDRLELFVGLFVGWAGTHMHIGNGAHPSPVPPVLELE